MRNALFQQVRIKRPKRNLFDMSSERKLSMKMGDLVPVYLQEVIPGDKFTVNTEMMMRLAPLVSPVMHRINVFTHFFFVPNRLVYSEWENFITGGVTGKVLPAFPAVDVSLHMGEKTLADYMGLPSETGGSIALEVNALPFRAYQLIYNEYYRDQNLQAPVALTKNTTVSPEEGDVITLLRKRCWEKDYFTSALPWTQRGDEVLLPSDMEITYKEHAQMFPGQSSDDDVIAEAAIAGKSNLYTDIGGGKILQGIENIDEITDSVTINELRRAFRLQEWLEKNARAGSRYIEQILSHFGVRSSDARLQRPEYLGGGKAPVVISESLSTVETATVPQANMAGHGISIGNKMGFRQSFEEHGFIIGIMSVLPRTCYQQGIERFWRKLDKLDYAWPEFAHLGEQAIRQDELFYDKTDVDDTVNGATFGYQSRFAEYKFNRSSVHGEFKNSLDFWHMGRIFDPLTPPALNSDFVESDPTKRVFAVTDEDTDDLYVQLYHNIKALRPLPIFGTPSF